MTPPIHNDPADTTPAAAVLGSFTTRPRIGWLILGALVLATILAYARVGQCGFVNLDDDAYVEFQPMVNQGFRSAAVVWALTTAHSSNWHPLTTFSHMLDCELFGVRAAPMHWENVLWHTLNAVLVFLVWRSLSGAVWRSALVAALFALHPLHVESVAWISERKDVLSTFFWLLGLWAYAAYVRHPSTRRYVAVAVALLLALLSKPMAVTFPCTLLLFDFWPLRRWPTRSWQALLGEKAPLFALVALHSVITYLAQHTTGADNFAVRFGFAERAGNALVAYARYLGKTIWPETLSPLYFYRGAWPNLTIIGAALLLASITAVAWRQRHSRPWLVFGWLWFLGTLVPVIGLVQVGAQSMADRYTYVPLLGIFTMLAWSAAEFTESRPQFRRGVVLAAAAALGLCFAQTSRQVPVWESSARLFEHSIAAGEDNPAVRYLLAVAYQLAGRPEADVVNQYQRALQLDPSYVNARTQLTTFALNHQRVDEARQLLEENCRFEPLNPSMHINLGVFFCLTGRSTEAIAPFTEALRLDPDATGAHHELAKIFLQQNRPDDARIQLEAAVRSAPWDPDRLCDLGIFLANLRHLDEARNYLQRAIWIRPDFARARDNLRILEQLAGQKN